MIDAFIVHSKPSPWTQSNWKRRCLHVASRFRKQKSYFSSMNANELLQGNIDETMIGKYSIVEAFAGHTSSEGDELDRVVYACGFSSSEYTRSRRVWKESMPLEYADPGDLAPDTCQKCGYGKRPDDPDGTQSVRPLSSAALNLACGSIWRYKCGPPDADGSYSSIALSNVRIDHSPLVRRRREEWEDSVQPPDDRSAPDSGSSTQTSDVAVAGNLNPLHRREKPPNGVEVEQNYSLFIAYDTTSNLIPQHRYCRRKPIFTQIRCAIEEV
ncbi:hypothetical protein K458DRAFT_388346 [Lentithecium fluviatile CBS 122367]|uniref:Uncharacterized protein n=1 Tax=Lentithecium fluviatile CBS 122367 TaxID=1168545 RepID=A0A6G1J5I4_9PLEO|nr:hypothetical protein K458DRAFT_388346 [Lentithecium fluviatile CBS 122367]